MKKQNPLSLGKAWKQRIENINICYFQGSSYEMGYQHGALF